MLIFLLVLSYLVRLYRLRSSDKKLTYSLQVSLHTRFTLDSTLGIGPLLPMPATSSTLGLALWLFSTLLDSLSCPNNSVKTGKQPKQKRMSRMNISTSDELHHCLHFLRLLGLYCLMISCTLSLHISNACYYPMQDALSSITIDVSTLTHVKVNFERFGRKIRLKLMLLSTFVPLLSRIRR
jgi:hypothetical protein